MAFAIVGGYVKSGSARGPGPRFRQSSSNPPGQIRASFWARAPGSVKSRRTRAGAAFATVASQSSTCEGDASCKKACTERHRAPPVVRLAVHCAAAELRLVAARVAGVGSTAVLYGWVWNVACERVWLLVVVCTNICRSIRKCSSKSADQPIHGRLRVMNEHAACGTQHSPRLVGNGI